MITNVFSNFEVPKVLRKKSDFGLFWNVSIWDWINKHIYKLSIYITCTVFHEGYPIIRWSTIFVLYFADTLVWITSGQRYGDTLLETDNSCSFILKMSKKEQRNINFFITSTTNVFLLKSTNLFDLKSISRSHCHKSNISFFLFTHWCYYFTRFTQLFIYIYSQ